MSKHRQVTTLLMLVIFMIGFLLVGDLALAGKGGDIELKQLSEKIKNKQSDIDGLRKKVAAYEKSLTEERSKANSLKNQIYILETQIKKKEAEIKLNKQEIEATNLEIKKTEEEVAQAEEGIIDKQDKISSFLRQLYVQDQRTELEIVIMNDSISDFFNSLFCWYKTNSFLFNDNIL